MNSTATTGRAVDSMPQNEADSAIAVEALFDSYRSTRLLTEQIVSGMQAEDMQLQSMTDASPAKWHLAHTTWFFETFILKNTPGYRPFNANYHYLFNSYYNSVGDQFQRPERGMLSRPEVAEITAYRHHVDEAMQGFLDELQDSQIRDVVLLGINHEQQHQELILTDIKHAFAKNPLFPALIDNRQTADRPLPALEYRAYDGELRDIGNDTADCTFCFDNETPRHAVFITPFKLANRPVSNGEYMQFIEDGGYRNPLLWLSDGWSLVQRQGLTCPAYWHKLDDGWSEFTLAGLQPLGMNNPVCHINYFEACAFATWAGKRLPTEFEWEVAAAQQPVTGNVLDMTVLHPRTAGDSGLAQLYGDIWEWTSSAYAAYPGFKPAQGALGEYNGKFMCGQYVLRGGSCATPAGHIRSSYRNFFYPHSYWQFSGVRLAADD